MKWAATYWDNALTAWAGRHKNDFMDSLTSVARLAEGCQDSLQSHVKGIGDIYDVCDTALVLGKKLP